MGRTLKKIREDIHASVGRDERKPKGNVTRWDIVELLENFKNEKDKKEAVSKFFDSLNEGILTYEQREKILGDLESYG